MSIGFPLLLIPLAICNIILFLMPGVSFSASLITVPLMSGAAWPVTLSDGLLALGLLLLLLEIMKAARFGAKYLTDHFLSLMVFGGAAAEFLLLPQFGTSTFFLLSLLALVDFLAGVTLRVRRPRRMAAPAPAPVVMPERVEPVPQPRVEPAVAATAPSPSVPAAASVAEAVLLDRPEPQIEPQAAQPAMIAHDSSPQVHSPDLQPGHGAPPSPDIPPPAR